MPLPAHLAKFDSLLDLLAESIAGEIEGESKTPTEGGTSVGVEVDAAANGDRVGGYLTLSESPPAKTRV